MHSSNNTIISKYSSTKTKSYNFHFLLVLSFGSLFTKVPLGVIPPLAGGIHATYYVNIKANEGYRLVPINSSKVEIVCSESYCIPLVCILILLCFLNEILVLHLMPPMYMLYSPCKDFQYRSEVDEADKDKFIVGVIPPLAGGIHATYYVNIKVNIDTCVQIIFIFT